MCQPTLCFLFRLSIPHAGHLGGKARKVTRIPRPCFLAEASTATEAAKISAEAPVKSGQMGASVQILQGLLHREIEPAAGAINIAVPGFARPRQQTGSDPRAVHGTGVDGFLEHSREEGLGLLAGEP